MALRGAREFDNVADFYMKHIFEKKDEKLIHNRVACMGFLDYFKNSESEHVMITIFSDLDFYLLSPAFLKCMIEYQKTSSMFSEEERIAI